MSLMGFKDAESLSVGDCGCYVDQVDDAAVDAKSGK
jgi:hypothetical protein